MPFSDWLGEIGVDWQMGCGLIRVQTCVKSDWAITAAHLGEVAYQISSSQSR